MSPFPISVARSPGFFATLGLGSTRNDAYHVLHKLYYSAGPQHATLLQRPRCPRRRRKNFGSAQVHMSSISASQKGSGGIGNGSRSILEYDVVIVGAGIVGLATAHHILVNTNLSVAIIDALQPCAGATGAGQGYIWMSHRSPGTPGWALASRSKLLWEKLVTELRAADLDAHQAIGWRNTGSLLVASTDEEAEALQKWVDRFSLTKVPAEYLSAAEALRKEPALASDHLAAAAYFPEDSQIDARLTVTLLQQKNQAFSSYGRYKELFQNPVHQFIGSPKEGHIRGVRTQEGEVYCKKAVVIATGAWSSPFMAKATADWGISMVPPVKPRKGHLLVLEGVGNINLRHGIMEFEYVSHADTSHVQVPMESMPIVLSSSLDLAMTATMDPKGNLLLGSSREFVGFDIHIGKEVVESILNRAAKFVRGLSHVSAQQILQNGEVRTGLRPFSLDGRPLIGSLQDVPGLIFATGHEGSGLCLALATAEMVVNAIQEVECVVDGSFFSPVGRLVSS